MKKQNGFIATSLIYTFFLAFVALFTGLLAVYLQNRVYLINLEDSSKNAIYIRELGRMIKNGDNFDTTYGKFTLRENGSIFSIDGSSYNLAKCKKIYTEKRTNGDDEVMTFFHLEGCEI